MPPKISGVGIDLVDLKRIREFLRIHAAAKTRRLLSPLEQKYFQSRKRSPLVFAKFFTAKEAFFKTLGKAWLGLEGFAEMEVQFLSADRFKIRHLQGAQAEGSFFSFSHYVGAQVIR